MGAFKELLHGEKFDAETAAEFEIEQQKQNVGVGFYLTQVIGLFEVLMILYKIFEGFRGTVDWLYLASYLVLFACSAATLLFILVIRSSAGSHAAAVRRVTYAYCAVLFLFGLAISALDLGYSDNKTMIVYLTIVMGISACVNLSPTAIALLYGITYPLSNLVTSLVPWGGWSSERFINTMVFNVIAVCIAVVRYRSHKRDFCQQKTITEKNVELEALNRRLNLISRTDRLTGLKNRWSMDFELNERLEACRLRGESLALVMFDLDHFKQINDRFGHRAGDECLIAFAALLQRRFGSENCYRFGGEEFIAVTGGAVADVLACAESMRAEVEQMRFSAEELRISTSVGVYSVLPDGGTNYDQLLRNADNALYAAKNGGRNRVCLYAEEER